MTPPATQLGCLFSVHDRIESSLIEIGPGADISWKDFIIHQIGGAYRSDPGRTGQLSQILGEPVAECKRMLGSEF